MGKKQPRPPHLVEKAIAVGGRIRVLRDKKGLSDKDLGDMVKFTRNAVTQWETGRAMPRPDTLQAIARALDTSVEWLLAGDDQAEIARAHTTSELEMLRAFREVPEAQKGILIAAAREMSRPKD